MAVSAAQIHGAKILQEIRADECTLEEILTIIRTNKLINNILPGLPSSLLSLYHAHTLKGPLAIKSNPSTAASTALINHILIYQLTICRGTVALLDFTDRFNVLPISSRCGNEFLSHLHIFRLVGRSSEAFGAVKRWMLYGNHASQNKEWVGTIIIGGERTREWDGMEGTLVSCSWNGWLNVGRDKPDRFATDASVEEAWVNTSKVESATWRAWCEEGEYKWS